jgi:bifunctional polynucleotide phosphatase/kinase
VAIISNQGAIKLQDKSKISQKESLGLTNFKNQVTSVLRQLELPINLYAATGQDKYRKPRTGMWKELLEDQDLQALGAADLSNSFFVGDAAGRARTDIRRKDHSSSDL